MEEPNRVRPAQKHTSCVQGQVFSLNAGLTRGPPIQSGDFASRASAVRLNEITIS